MTVQTTFFDWQTCGLDWLAPPYDACSPNLGALHDHLAAQWGGAHLGCHVDREVREGDSISSHAYGAALDWRYEDPGPGRETLLEEIVPFLVDHSLELGIDAIHDYVGCRIWRPPGTSGRASTGDGWKEQTPSGDMGSAASCWIHVETLDTTFSDPTPIAQRLTTIEEDTMIIIVKDTRAPYAHWLTNGVVKTWVDDGDVVNAVLAPAADATESGHTTPAGLQYREVETADDDVIASFGAVVGPVPSGYDGWGRKL